MATKWTSTVWANSPCRYCGDATLPGADVCDSCLRDAEAEQRRMAEEVAAASSHAASKERRTA